MRTSTQTVLNFQPMTSSYTRLAAHRVAQHYLLVSQAVDPIPGEGGGPGRIVARKTADSRFPTVRLADLPAGPASPESLPPGGNQPALKLAIKQRPQKGMGNGSAPAPVIAAKTVEERKEDYDRARARIFSSGSLSGLAGSGGEEEAASEVGGREVGGGASLGEGVAGKSAEEARSGGDGTGGDVSCM